MEKEQGEEQEGEKEEEEKEEGGRGGRGRGRRGEVSHTEVLEAGISAFKTSVQGWLWSLSHPAYRGAKQSLVTLNS